MSRYEPITEADGVTLRRPVTPKSPLDDLFQCALVLGREPPLAASRAVLVALIWPEDPS